MSCFLIITTIIVTILVPQDALCWGPAFHVELGLKVISQASIVAIPSIAYLIKKFADDFLYGATTPDIMIAKKIAGYFYHCHNWHIADEILSRAESDAEKAAAYGYLVHLAADVVAHNYYIPVKIIRSYKTKLLNHSYWELRFDFGVGDEAWKRLEDFKGGDFNKFDLLLEKVLKPTLFGFRINKRIFNVILRLQRMISLRKSARMHADHSKYRLEVENRNHYVDLVWESVTAFLKDPENAPCRSIDPAGRERIAYAKDIRANMRRRYVTNSLEVKDGDKFAELTKEQLALALYRPKFQLPQLS